jgi:hypothetical protein
MSLLILLQELARLREGDKLSLLCRSSSWQRASLNDLVQSHHLIPSKVCAFLDKTAAICEIFNVWIVNRLIG